MNDIELRISQKEARVKQELLENNGKSQAISVAIFNRFLTADYLGVWLAILVKNLTRRRLSTWLW